MSEGIRISHKVDSIAYSVSDLVAQRTTVSTGQVDAILTAAATIMSPYSAANLTIVVSVLDVNSGAASVDWSRAYNASAQSSGDTPLEALSANVLQNGVQLVQSTVTYNYTNSVLSTLLDSLIGHSAYSFTRHFVERPRASDTIVLN